MGKSQQKTRSDISVGGSGAAATQGGVAAGKGGIAVGGDYTVINNLLQSNVELPEELIVPFEVSEEKFKDVTFYQLSLGNFTADDILIKSTFNFSRSFIPIYLIKGNYSAHLSYTAVDYVCEEYTEYVNERIDGKWQKFPVTKTREKKVISHLDKEIPHTRFTELSVATDLSDFLGIHFNISKLHLFCKEWILVKSKIKSFQGKFTKEPTIAPLSVDQNEAKSQINGRIKKLIKDRICRNLQGHYQENKNLIQTINIDDDVKIVYLPLWFAIYSYGDKKYFLAMDGQDSSRFIESNKPKDTSRYWRIFRIFIKYCWLPVFLLILILSIHIFVGGIFLETNLNNIILALILPIIISLFISGYKSKDLINTSKQTRKRFYQKVKNGSIKIKLGSDFD